MKMNYQSASSGLQLSYKLQWNQQASYSFSSSSSAKSAPATAAASSSAAAASGAPSSALDISPTVGSSSSHDVDHHCRSRSFLKTRSSTIESDDDEEEDDDMIIRELSLGEMDDHTNNAEVRFSATAISSHHYFPDERSPMAVVDKKNDTKICPSISREGSSGSCCKRSKATWTIIEEEDDDTVKQRNQRRQSETKRSFGNFSKTKESIRMHNSLSSNKNAPSGTRIVGDNFSGSGDDVLGVSTSITTMLELSKQCKHVEAVKISAATLRQMNIDGYHKNQGSIGSRWDIRMNHHRYVTNFLQNHTDNEILAKVPVLTDPKGLEVVDLLFHSAHQSLHLGDYQKLMADTLLAIRWSFDSSTSSSSSFSRYGLSGQLACSLVHYAVLCSRMNDMDTAYRTIHLADRIVTELNDKQWVAIIAFVETSYLTPWKDTQKSVLEVIRHGCIAGFECGDTENAVRLTLNAVNAKYAAGHTLVTTMQDCKELIRRADQYDMEFTKTIALQTQRKIQYLIEGGSDGAARRTTSIKGESSNSDSNGLPRFNEILPTSTTQESPKSVLVNMYLCQLELAIYVGKYEFAKSVYKLLKPLAEQDCSYRTTSLTLYYGSLTYAALSRDGLKLHTKSSCRKISQYRREAKKLLNELTELSNKRGMNSWHRCLVMAAQISTVAGYSTSSNKKTAFDSAAVSSISSKFDKAIENASYRHYWVDVGLASQLAAEYFLDVAGDLQLGRRYLSKSIEAYKSWGAMTLVDHLQMKYGCSDGGGGHSCESTSSHNLVTSGYIRTKHG